VNEYGQRRTVDYWWQSAPRQSISKPHELPRCGRLQGGRSASAEQQHQLRQQQQLLLEISAGAGQGACKRIRSTGVGGRRARWHAHTPRTLARSDPHPPHPFSFETAPAVADGDRKALPLPPCAAGGCGGRGTVRRRARERRCMCMPGLVALRGAILWRAQGQGRPHYSSRCRPDRASCDARRARTPHRSGSDAELMSLMTVTSSGPTHRTSFLYLMSVYYFI